MRVRGAVAAVLLLSAGGWGGSASPASSPSSTARTSTTFPGPEAAARVCAQHAPPAADDYRESVLASPYTARWITAAAARAGVSAAPWDSLPPDTYVVRC